MKPPGAGPESFPRDVRIGLGIAAGALGLIGMYAVWVGGQIALRGGTVPAFVGMVLTLVMTGLVQFGKWVLDYATRKPSEDDESPTAR